MTPLTANDYRAKTGQKRGVREHNKQMRSTVEEQHHYVEHIIGAASDRIAQRLALGIPIDLFTVWNDFDPPTGINFQTSPRKLPKWRELSEYMKFQLAGVCVLAGGGYSFTARLNPDLEKLWVVHEYDFYEMIKRRIATQFRADDLGDVRLAYVVEGKTKRGCRTGIHLHGFFFDDNDTSRPNKVKSAIEAALSVGLHRKGRRRGRDVKMEPMYDTGLSYGDGPGQWAAYSCKNATKPDTRLPNRRIYVSQQMTRTAKMMWGLISEVAIGKE